MKVEVSGSKPLSGAVAELQALCACPITYEDAPLENPDEVVEVSPGAKAGPRKLVPRGGALVFSYALHGAGVRADVEGALRELLRIYGDRRLPGRFKLERDGGMLHVTPTSVRSKAGSVVPVASVLDSSVTLAEGEWLAPEAIQAILDGVREASGTTITLVNYPVNLLAHHRVRMGADNEPARTVLARLLATHPVTMSWGIGYDISSRQYRIGIHVVRPRPESQ